MAEPPVDIPQAHRWFAMHLNNLAWDLVEAETRSEEDVERMIDAAHASCYHWCEAGTPLNHQRARCLLATAYVAAGQFDAAVRHAERCLSLSEQNADSQTAFDRATAHGCAARAYLGAGRRDEAQRRYQRATEAAAACNDSDDRRVFEQLYPAV